MTDAPSSPTDPNDDDLLASLYLDGEATPEEQARVEASPELMAKVEAFAAIAEELPAVTPPPELRRAQIAAALDLFDQQQAPVQPADASVTSLGARREAKQARGLPSWLGAAAALVLVVGGLGFATTLRGDSDDESAAIDAAADSAEPSASLTNRDAEAASTTQAESFATEEGAAAEMAEMEADVAADDAMDDSAGEAMEEAMEEEAMEEEPPSETVEESDEEAETRPAPIPLDELQAVTAAEYFSLLGDPPLLPLSDSPCADSPVVDALTGVDSYLPVIFEGQQASLLLEASDATTAIIVGPTCQIELT